MPVVTAPISEPRTLVTHPELKSQQSFPFFKALGEPPKSVLERALSVFADVRAGEGIGVVLMTASVFLLLGAYYLLKPARDGLTVTEVGAEVKSYLSAAQAVLLIGVVPLYGWLASRVARVPLITSTMVFIAANLVVFSFAGQSGVRVGVPYFVWLGIVNMFVVSQFWALANDLYSEGQGRRLFPMIGVGGSLGAVVGAMLVKPLIDTSGFTPYTLMLLAVPVFLLALALMYAANRRETTRAEPDVARANDTPLGREGGFELILRDRYLLWTALLVLILNFVNSTGQFLIDKLFEVDLAARIAANPALAAESKAVATAFYGSFTASVNGLGLVLQLFVASRVVRFMGVRGALFVGPVLACVNYSVMAVAPLLAVVRVGKIVENGTDYSIQNTIRQALFLPTTREAKYKAKAAIDTFFARTGDVMAAALVGAGRAFGGFVPTFAALNIALTLVWMFVAGQLAREHRRKTV